MLEQVFKQIWARRCANGWVLLELAVVFTVTWLVIDPLYVIQYQKNAIAQGFDPENVYRISVGTVPAGSPPYDTAAVSDEILTEHFERIVRHIRAYPDVEAVAVVESRYPWSGAYSGNSYNLHGDSVSVQAQELNYIAGYDFFKVFRYTSASDHTWQTLENSQTYPDGLFITRDFKKKLFGDAPVAGKSVARGSKLYSVNGVMNPVKGISFRQPAPVVIVMRQKIDPGYIREGRQNIFVRIKEGTSEKKFIRNFKKEMSGKLRIGNLYMSGIVSYDRIRDEFEEMYGTASDVRMHTALAVFFLVNMFLGVFAVFWFRSETRRDEIGLRMAVGGTPRSLRLYFLMEGWALTTVAFAIGMLVQFQIVYFKGFFTDTECKVEEAWPVNNFTAHFLFVSLIVYGLLLLTVLIASWLPAYRASRTDPVAALRDE